MSVLEAFKVDGSDAPELLPDDPDLLYIKGDAFVISRGRDGSVKSTYGNKDWDLSTLNPSGERAIFRFTSWLDNDANTSDLTTQITGQMKQIMFARLFCYTKAKRVPSSFKMAPLNLLAKLAYSKRTTIFNLLIDHKYHSLIVSNYSNTARDTQRHLLRLIDEIAVFTSESKLNDLHQTRATPMFELLHVLASVEVRLEDIDYELSQTPIIPSRIYAEFISYLSSELDEVKKISKKIVRLYEARHSFEHPKGYEAFGRPPSKVKGIKGATLWSDEIEKIGLHRSFDRLGIEHWESLRLYLLRKAWVCRYWIMLFTGMRRGEMLKLPFNCLTKLNTKSGKSFIIRGYTHKTLGSGQLISAEWISGPIIEKAITVAKAIAQVNGFINGFDMSEKDVGMYPLFPAFKINNDNSDSSTWTYPSAPLQTWTKHPYHKSIDAIVVTQEDIEELNKFMAFRDWEGSDSIKLGEHWPIAPHQCRRSLAVYAARSGNVSLGVLKHQFKHLTREMTLYYQNRSAWAVSILNSEDEALEDVAGLIKTIELERKLSEFLLFENEVMNSSDRFWGGEGNRIDSANQKGAPLVIVENRESTLERFKQGHMTYKEGPLGGCTNPEPCDRISLTVIDSCVTCTWAINNSETINKLVSALNRLQRQLNLFPRGSLFHNQLRDEEKKLMKTIDIYSQGIEYDA